MYPLPDCKSLATYGLLMPCAGSLRCHHLQTCGDTAAGAAFQANLQDPRFKSLFSSADFALDPTDPRFKQLEGSKAIARTVSNHQQQQQAQGTASASLIAQPSRNGMDTQVSPMAAEVS